MVNNHGDKMVCCFYGENHDDNQQSRFIRFFCFILVFHLYSHAHNEFSTWLIVLVINNVDNDVFFVFEMFCNVPS